MATASQATAATLLASAWRHSVTVSATVAEIGPIRPKLTAARSASGRSRGDSIHPGRIWLFWRDIESGIGNARRSALRLLIGELLNLLLCELLVVHRFVEFAELIDRLFAARGSLDFADSLAGRRLASHFFAADWLSRLGRLRRRLRIGLNVEFELQPEVRTRAIHVGAQD